MLLHRDLRELGLLVEGSMVIPRQSLNKPIPYKYVIHRGGSSKDSVDYEFIYEESKKKGEHVNRSLLVDSARLSTGGGKSSRGLSGSAQLLGLWVLCLALPAFALMLSKAAFGSGFDSTLCCVKRPGWKDLFQGLVGWKVIEGGAGGAEVGFDSDV